MRLNDLTEGELLCRIVPRLPVGRGTILGPGDDAAILAVPGGRVAVTADVLVEGRHFRRAWSSGADVGWRAAVQNLADVAAMGATPVALVVSVAAPGNLEVAWFDAFADGLAQACAPHGVGVAGGDLSSADQIVVAVTALGIWDGTEPVARSGARPGDLVALAGRLGWSAAGLAVLSAAAVPAGAPLDGPDALRAIALFRRPEPALLAGPTAARAGASAMLDVSDGLLLDATRLAEASGVIVHLDTTAPPLASAIDGLAPLADVLDVDPRTWVLMGGEDHALLATFPADTVLTGGFAVIGHVGEADDAGPGVRVDSHLSQGLGGWDHFASGASSAGGDGQRR
jgi:thiamine-monophosphate kinase